MSEDIKKAAELDDENLDSVNGGTYIPGFHQLDSENIRPDGIHEVIYYGWDKCPMCGVMGKTYYYQQDVAGSYNVNFLCLSCFNKLT